MKPAELLESLDLDGGWKVGRPLGSAAGSSGGNFSYGYEVARTDDRGRPQYAYLKALDLSEARNMGMPLLDALNILTSAAAHERDVVMSCSSMRMRNVVRGIDAGQVTITDTRMDPALALIADVPYIIFEQASTDVRAAFESGVPSFDAAWGLRMLHGASSGLRQMHAADMAHQDVKPSNIMVFGDLGKVGDLGRASPPGGNGIFDGYPFAGDLGYAPPELLYREFLPDDRARRRASDLYQLGGLISFFFLGTAFTGLWSAHLNPAFHWRTWPNDYRTALPYVRQACDEAFLSVSGALPSSCALELEEIIRQLCEPDPLLRGDPRRSNGPTRYDMERYISKFDRLARRLEIDISRATVP